MTGIAERPALSVRQARRLALARSGLLKPAWTNLPASARTRDRRARHAAHRVIERFGYLQLDSVSVSGARSHAIVLMSRLAGFSPEVAESLLQPAEPLFEYWGHEASWLPLELYPVMEFRRHEYRHHPWWGDVLGRHPKLADELLEQLRDRGPLRSIDLEGKGKSSGWWQYQPAKKVLTALWSRGDVAIRERRHFQRVFDLAERVIPEPCRSRSMTREESLKILLLRALDGHGWAQTGTLASTWRLRGLKKKLEAALAELVEEGEAMPCDLVEDDGRRAAGWIRARDLELVDRLDRVRGRRDEGVLLSPFDPVLWDRPRVRQLFGFEQTLEIYKPAAQRTYGYYCLPVLAADALVGRVDLKADRATGRLRVLAKHYEEPVNAEKRRAVESAIARFACCLDLSPTDAANG